MGEKGSETAQGGAGGGGAADELPPELLEAFGRAGGGAGSAAGAGGSASDAELERALEAWEQHASEVDRILQEEQARAEAARGDRGRPGDGGRGGATGSSGSGGGSASGSGYGPGSGSADDPAEGGSAESATASAGIPGGEALDSSRPSNDLGYPTPPDVGDGSDDDTLARQLRELAMNEPDPELRERYWEEYRKHKGID